MCEGNIHALTLEGNPDIEDLYKAWEMIITEYSEAIGNAEYKYYVVCLRDVLRLQMTLDNVERVIEVLRDRYAKEFEVMLNSLLHSDLHLDPSNPEEYDRTLKRAYSMSRGIKMNLDMNEMRLADIVKTMSGGEVGEKPTRAYFEEVLIVLSDHSHGVPLDDKIMVSQYCIRLRRYTKYIQTQNNK